MFVDIEKHTRKLIPIKYTSVYSDLNSQAKNYGEITVNYRDYR